MGNKIEVSITQGLDVPNIFKDEPNFVKDASNFVKDVPNFLNDAPKLPKSILRWGMTSSNHFPRVSEGKN